MGLDICLCRAKEKGQEIPCVCSLSLRLILTEIPTCSDYLLPIDKHWSFSASLCLHCFLHELFRISFFKEKLEWSVSPRLLESITSKVLLATRRVSIWLSNPWWVSEGQIPTPQTNQITNREKNLGNLIYFQNTDNWKYHEHILKRLAKVQSTVMACALNSSTARCLGTTWQHTTTWIRLTFVHGFVDKPRICQWPKCWWCL